MPYVNRGTAIKSDVSVSAYARAKREGFAVFVGEEDDVRMITGRRTARLESARLMNAEGAMSGGWYRVTRRADGVWVCDC